LGSVAALICAISFALLMLAAIVVVLKLARTMSITNHILNDMRKEAIPLMGKLQTTMDHINNEMGYIDGVLRSTEKMAARANSATKAAQKLVTSPLVRILSLGLGVQRALGFTASRKERVKAETDKD
jgi:predicted PurR-regulated permease PerM